MRLAAALLLVASPTWALPALAQVPALAPVPASAQEPALPSQPGCAFPGQAPMLLVRLYFGQSIARADGPAQVVGRRAWERFVAERVTPALPDGFTVLEAYGQHRDRGAGTIAREATEVVEVAAPDTPAFRARVAAIAEAYKRQFSQGAVGVVSQTVCGLF